MTYVVSILDDNGVTWGRQVAYNIAILKRIIKCTWVETHAGMRRRGVRLGTPNWSDRQRELRASTFLPDDYRNKKPRSGSSDVPALRYGETEFPYESHQECLHLHETSMNWMSVRNLDRRKFR